MGLIVRGDSQGKKTVLAYAEAPIYSGS